MLPSLAIMMAALLPVLLKRSLFRNLWVSASVLPCVSNILTLTGKVHIQKSRWNQGQIFRKGGVPFFAAGLSDSQSQLNDKNNWDLEKANWSSRKLDNQWYLNVALNEKRGCCGSHFEAKENLATLLILSLFLIRLDQTLRWAKYSMLNILYH